MPTPKKPKDIDITKDGPQSYRDLQQANREAFSSATTSSLANIRPSRDYITSASTIYNGYEQSPLLQSGNDYWGSSIWDNPTANEEDWQNNLGDIRAENQPWYSQIANGLAKGLVLAGTTFLDGTVGLLLGAGSAIGEGRWSALWDNDFSKAMQSVNEWSEQAMPNYYTQQEQEDPWYENIFTANFLGDKFLKNLGFTVGAFYSGGLESGLIKGAGRALAGAARTAQAVKNITRATDMVASGVGAVTSAVNEGRIEALNNSTDWYNTQKELITQAYNAGQIDDAQYADALAKANEDRLHMGNADLLMNLPILTASNLIQFGKMYANGMKTAKKSLSVVGKPGEYMAGSGKGKNVFNAVKGALSEGVEEISQSAASRIAGNYYATDVNNFLQAKIDPDASQETLDWVKAFAKGINETVNDGSAWEEFFIGALTGALGMPRARAIRNEEGKLQSPITIEGGMYNELRESRERRLREQEVADYMNNRFESPEFRNYYQGLIRHNKYQNDMNTAVENDDAFNFHNAEHAQMVSDIIMFDKAGKLEDLVSMVNGAFNTDDANLESIARNTADENGNGPFMDNGNPKYSTEAGKQEMIEQLEKNKQTILDTIDSYNKAKEDVLLEVPTGVTLSDDQVEELAWMKTQIDNWNNRAVSMSGNIKDAIGKIIGDVEGDITVLSAIRTQEGMEHPDLTEEYLKADEQINKLKKISSFLNYTRSLPDEVLANKLSNSGATDFIDGIKENLEFLDETTLSKEDKAEVTKQLDDIKKLGNGKELFLSKFNEYISKPEKQVLDHQKAEEKAAKTEETKANIKKKDFLDNADVSSLVNGADAGEIDLRDLERLVKEDQSSDVNDARIAKIESAIGVIDEFNALQDRILAVADETGVEAQTVQDALALLEKQKSLSENPEQLADTTSEVYNNIENLVSNVEQMDADSLNARADAAKALIANADSDLAAARASLSGLPTEVPEGLMNPEDEADIPEVGHDSITTGPAVNGTSGTSAQDTGKPAYIKEALKDIKTLMPNLNDSQANSAAEKLGQVYEKLHSIFMSEGSVSHSIGNILEGDTSFKELVNIVKQGNASKLLADRIKKYINPQPEAQSDSPATNPQPNTNRLVTPDISDVETIEKQLDAEHKRKSDLPDHYSTAPSYNYWKRTTSEYYIHPSDLPRGTWLTTPEWADEQVTAGKLTERQAARIKAVHEFLSSHNAFDNVNNGEVTINTKDATKPKPIINFVTVKSLNKKAALNDGEEEVVILMVTDQGRIVGDLGSKLDANTAKQVGIIDFINKAEKEYNDKKDRYGEDDFIPLSGSTTVLQNLIGSPKYTASDDRRTLNEIWEGKNFKLAVAAASGKNSDMLMSGRSLKAGKTDDEKMILPPLDAKAGQPYVLLTTSSMGDSRHYYPVPFIMPKFSSETKDSSLGREVQAIIRAGIESQNWEIIKGNANKGYPGLPELLGVDKVSVSFNDKGNIKIGIQINDVWHNPEIPLSDPNVVNKMVDSIAAIGIPFQISRKYINGTYTPTGQSYNQMIGELAQTNLPVGGTHTVGEWFTINPIGSDGTPQRGSLMRPTGVNPNAVARESRQGEIEVSINGFTYYVDLAGNKVRSRTGEFTGELADTCIAKARCVKQGWDGVSHNIYKCGIGWFDPILNKWVPKPADAQATPAIEVTVPNIQQATNDNTDLDSAIAAMMNVDETAVPEEATQMPSAEETSAETLPTEQRILQIKANLLGEQEEIFDAMTPEQQAKLAAIDNEAMINTIMDSIEVEIWDNGEFTGNVDSYIDSKFSLEESREYDRKWNERKERAWLSKALPQLSSIEVARTHNGLIKVGNSTYAYGQFKDGIITIAEAAARGTLYHEAFHAVTWTLFNTNERKELFDEAKKQYGVSNDLETEERLAEDFRKYVQIEEAPVVGKIVRFFRRLKHMINGLLGREQYLDKVFYSINRGLYAGRQVNSTNTTKLNKYTAEEEEILRNAPRNAEGRLLAPNGKPSNLSERQYIQVRTKAFKNWFGDWENDPENSSKVVDENGEPLVVYHGGSLVNIFDTTGKTKAGGAGIIKGDNGTYFTTSKNSAMRYEDIHDYKVGDGLLYTIEEMQAQGRTDEEIDKEWNEGILLALRSGTRAFFLNIRNPKRRHYESDSKIGKRTYKPLDTNISDKNDGQRITVEDKSEVEYVAFSPIQIKSATDNIGTFDPNNPDIRYRLIENVADLNSELARLRSTYRKLRAMMPSIKTFNNQRHSESEARGFVARNSPAQGAMYAFESKYSAGWKVGTMTQKEYNERVRDLNSKINRAYEAELSDDERLSRQALEEQLEYEQRIEQYHREKFEYGNLTDEQKEYLEMRKVPIEEYNRMTDFEREVLFHCMGI